MIRHILLVKFKSKAGSKAILEVFKNFEAIPSKIDGLSSVEGGRTTA